jgi:hypothetical protein
MTHRVSHFELFDLHIELMHFVFVDLQLFDTCELFFFDEIDPFIFVH